MAGCARTLYGLRTLLASGMPQACLQLVFRSTALAKLLYASPTWWGFANASERNGLEAFLRRDGKSDDSLPTVAALCEQTDKQLFRSIKYIPTHPPFDHSYHPSAVHHIAHVHDHITTNYPLK